MTHADKGEVLSILESIDQAAKAELVLGLCMKFANRFGFDRFLITQVVNPYGPDASKAMTHTNWNDELMAQRFEGLKLLHDPVVQFGLRSRFPFAWTQAYEHASKYGKRIMDEARPYNLLAGYSFPMRRPGAPIGGVSLGAERYVMSAGDRADMELVAMHTYSRLEQLHPHHLPAKNIQLSPQETDVLQFSALGKSAWEIAKVLGITESGVKKALLRARRKLGAVNTAQACSSAISHDLILP